MIEQKEIDYTVFPGLDQNQIQQIQSVLELCSFSHNKVIFNQGEAADFLYILLNGEVVIRYKPYDGPALIVAQINKGMVFGWSAALNRDVYSSAAIAKKDCSAYRIHTRDLHQLCDKFPETGSLFLDHIASLITQRIQSTHAEILNILKGGMDLNGECLRRMENGGTTFKPLS